ncbi:MULTISPECIES: ABC transporter substrate-binding protein [Rothia]|uniref:Glycine/betaine ABC transporter substrate-binding protein n=1 Tax=Rothia nasimurium TaxID=85336 RepID=A0A1Y1RQN3_9MICC|nr:MULTISPECIES: ABC transporter substrate-binding protein [Rothia]ORC22095.1 glycine/betaine ABC transporter substrate-binding protein [Rothia nasimurium]
MSPLNRRHFLAGLGLGATALALAACGNSGENALGGSGASAGGTITVGSADFTESQIIAEIYAAALNARGLEATTSPAIGAREAYIGALTEGTVSVVPDYSGNLLLYFDKESTAKTSDEVLAALSEALDDSLLALDASPAQNKDSLVVTSATAAEKNLASLEDLAAHSGQLSVGAPPEFAQRAYGLPGLKSVYGFEPSSFEPINDGAGPLTVAALTDGTVDIVDLFSTDPAIAANNFVVLEDPKNMILPQQVLPLINAEAVSEGARAVLNELSAKLTTEVLVELNTRVSGDEKANPATAAGDWVAQNFS